VYDIELCATGENVMKIAIIGGCGYLGSHLTNKLEQKHEVVVYDTNVFSSAYLPVKAKVKSTNFIDIQLMELEEYEIIFICSTIDIGSFYSEESFKKYQDIYFDKILECGQLIETDTVVFTTMDENLNKDDGLYYNYQTLLVNGIEKQLNRNIAVIPTPELYGGTLRVRSDLFVNNMLSEFFQYNRYMVEDELLRHLCFSHVSKFTDWIVNGLTNIQKCGLPTTEEFEYCEMSRFMIANYVSWMLGPDYELYVRPEDNMMLECTGDYAFSETSQLEYTLSLYTKLVEERNFSDLFDMHSNNRYIVNNSLIGNRFTKSILNDKSVSKLTKPVTVGGNCNNK